MEKTFTVNVPDDLWVDLWTEEKTAEYTYSGPASINVLVALTDTFEIIRWSEDAIEDANEDTEQVVVLDADTHTSIAKALQGSVSDYEYTYTTITNHDGSTHDEINNPQINDIYEVSWTPAGGFELVAIIKQPETMNERIARERLAYVVKYDNAYDYDDATQGVIDTFKAAMATYLTTMATVYPWRYVTIDDTVIPRIPASLVSTFNTLPEIS
jgi:hypothetical protein